METIEYKTALIVGAGMGLSAALARLFTRKGIRVVLAARQTDKLARLCKEIDATVYACDATSLDDVTRLFAAVERDCGAPDLVVYNAGARVPGAFVDLIPADVARSIAVNTFGGFLVAQQASRRMLPNRHGAILFHRRISERERLSAVCSLRDGQVRIARSRTEHGP
jgi:NAD(P)-dependent dehydrogenase (short-subunit alcohol dehydrogenase family)